MSFPILIGHDRTNKPVYYFTTLRHGVTVLEASTRVGKTQIARCIYVEQAAKYHRPTLIFCYEGEHKFSKFANLDKREGRPFGIPHLASFSNIVFKISEFDTEMDWENLGFPPGASRLLAKFAVQYKTYHEENFELFYNILRDHPHEYSKYTAWQRFMEKYGWQPENVINKKSQESIIDRMPAFDYMFWKDGEDIDQFWTENWAELLKRLRCIHINFGLKAEDKRMVLRSRAIAGKILIQLGQFAKGYKNVTYLELLHPLLVFEEADRIFPYISTEEVMNMPGSVLKLQEYITKKQKYGVELLLITQNISMLHPSAMQNFHTIICGVGGSASKLTEYLHWDIDMGLREFLLIRKGKWKQEIFQPVEVPAMLAPQF